jgi:hypothetical protein
VIQDAQPVRFGGMSSVSKCPSSEFLGQGAA